MSNSFESVEGENNNESSPAIFFDELIHNLDGEEFAEFKERVFESNGLIRVFVHPLHMIENEEINVEKFNSGGKELPLGGKPFYLLYRILDKKSSPPVIIFQPAEQMEILQAMIEKYWTGSHVLHPLYVVPTVKNNSFPIIKGIPEYELGEDNEPTDETFANMEKAVLVFIRFLDIAGVSKILVGGAELRIKDHDIEGCVGVFISLIKHFSDKEVSLSAGTIPKGRKDLREVGRIDLL